MSILYEVNLKVTSSILSEFFSWLRTHVEEMLQFDGFIEATIYEDISKLDEIVVSYVIISQEALQDYFDKHATQMRDKGLAKFGDQFSAQRRILKMSTKMTR